MQFNTSTSEPVSVSIDSNASIEAFHLEAALRDNFEAETNTCLLSCPYRNIEETTRNQFGYRH